MMASTPDHGPPQLAGAIVIEDVATGTRGTVKRARRRDHVASLNLAAEEYQALYSWGIAAEHCDSGRGLGPMPWQRDTLIQRIGEALPAQMRALSAAEWHRVGTQAAGAVAYPVLWWVVLSGGTLGDYDAARRWRHGTARVVLVAAAERMAEVYGFAQRRRRSIGLSNSLDSGEN